MKINIAKSIDIKKLNDFIEKNAKKNSYLFMNYDTIKSLKENVEDFTESYEILIGKEKDYMYVMSSYKGYPIYYSLNLNYGEVEIR